MNEIEKGERINKIETELIETVENRSHNSMSLHKVLWAINLLAKRPGKKIDEVLLIAATSDDGKIARAAFKALENRLSYLESK